MRQLHSIHGNARASDDAGGLGTRYPLGVGRSSDAIAEFRRAAQAMDDPPFARAGLANALAQAGQRDEATRILAEIERQRASGYYPAYALAMVHVGLGDHDEALNWLDRAVDERLMGYYLPSVGQVWDPLRSHDSQTF